MTTSIPDPAGVATPHEAASLADLLQGRLPDRVGRFGPFGGRFIPETLMPAVLRLEEAFREAWSDRAFRSLRTG